MTIYISQTFDLQMILVVIGMIIAVGIAAKMLGRDGLRWGLLAVILTPVITGLLLFFISRNRDAGAAPAEGGQ